MKHLVVSFSAIILVWAAFALVSQPPTETPRTAQGISQEVQPPNGSSPPSVDFANPIAEGPTRFIPSIQTVSSMGLVQDGKGYPFAGATVTLYEGELDHAAAGERLDRTQTDGDGVFEFEVDPGAGPYFVAVRGRGSNRVLQPCVPGDTVLVTIERAEDPAFLEVVARDIDGRPIQEYTVQASTAGRTRQALIDDRSVFASDGRFRGVVQLLPGQDTPIEVSIRARGFRELVVGPMNVRPGDDAALFEASLEPVGIVWGTVLGGDGAPLADAAVRVISSAGLPLPDVRTDGTGRFELAHGEAEDLDMLLVQAPGYAPQRITEPLSGWSGIEVQLASGGTIRGEVLGDDDERVSGASVIAWVEHGSQDPESFPLPIWRRAIATGKAGRFEIRNVPEGEVRLALFEQGEDRSLRFQRIVHVKVNESDTAYVGLNMASAEPITGRIQAPEGLRNAVLWVDLHAADASADADPISRTFVRSGEAFELQGSNQQGPHVLRIHTSRAVFAVHEFQCSGHAIDLGDVELGFDSFPGVATALAEGGARRQERR